MHTCKLRWSGSSGRSARKGLNRGYFRVLGDGTLPWGGSGVLWRCMAWCTVALYGMVYCGAVWYSVRPHGYSWAANNGTIGPP